MSVFLSIAFFIELIAVSTLLHNIAVIRKYNAPVYLTNLGPKYAAIYVFLFYQCVHYLGLLFGIILFLIQFFGLLHVTFGWVFTCSHISSPFKMMKAMERDAAWLTPTIILTFLFNIPSWWFVDKGFLYDLIAEKPWILIVVLIAAVLGFVIRIFVTAHLTKKFVSYYDD